LTLIFLIAAKNQGPNQKRRTGASDSHSAGMPGRRSAGLLIVANEILSQLILHFAQ